LQTFLRFLQTVLLFEQTILLFCTAFCSSSRMSCFFPDHSAVLADDSAFLQIVLLSTETKLRDLRDAAPNGFPESCADIFLSCVTPALACHGLAHPHSRGVWLPRWSRWRSRSG